MMNTSWMQAQYLPLYAKIPNYIDAPNEESVNDKGVYMIMKVSVPGYAFFSAGEEGAPTGASTRAKRPVPDAENNKAKKLCK